MTEPLHPSATHNLPWFIAAPGQSDVLLIATAVFLVLFVFLAGLLYFRLHHLPEHIAGKSKKVQLEIVAVLSLIAMFTHYNIFWIAALLLAFIDLPDFITPLRRIAGSTEALAQQKSGLSGASSVEVPHPKQAHRTGGAKRDSRSVESSG